MTNEGNARLDREGGILRGEIAERLEERPLEDG